MFWFRLPFQINIAYYIATILIAILAVVILRFFRLNWTKCVAAALSISYLFLILSITVFTRSHVDLALFKLDSNILPPFWTYREILRNDSRKIELIAQVIMNVLMLAPLGFLIPIVTNKHPILIGIGCSLFIEFAQLVSQRGYFEIDDIIHNSIGVIIGYFVWKLLMKLSQHIKKPDVISQDRGL